jgi:hypothetical protein
MKKGHQRVAWVPFSMRFVVFRWRKGNIHRRHHFRWNIYNITVRWLHFFGRIIIFFGVRSRLIVILGHIFLVELPIWSNHEKSIWTRIPRNTLLVCFSFTIFKLGCHWIMLDEIWLRRAGVQISQKDISKCQRFQFSLTLTHTHTQHHHTYTIIQMPVKSTYTP